MHVEEPREPSDALRLENMAASHLDGHVPSAPHPEHLATADAEEEELSHLPWMVRLTVLCLVTLAVGSVLDANPHGPHWLGWAAFTVAYLSGGFFSTRKLWASLMERQFDINFLMIVAAVGAAVIDQPREGAILIFLFALSGTLETYAMGRTHASIRALLDMTPKEAEAYRDGAVRRVPVDDLRVGDVVLVRPGAQVPADGDVLKGESALNEASITGESLPVEKGPGARVFAGTLNGQGALEVRVTTAVQDSTLARIVQVVKEARDQKAASQDFTDRVIGRYYAYAVVAIAVLAVAIPLLFLGWDLKTTLQRAMTLMVVASPCALVISIPAAVLSALASAARAGVLFKGGRHLETAARIRVVAFDKTGTLTTGKPGVVAVIPVRQMIQIGAGRAPCLRPDGIPCKKCWVDIADDPYMGDMSHRQVQILTVAAAVEKPSEHPLAHAIVQSAEERGLPTLEANDFSALTGAGAEATVCGRYVRIGRPSLFGEIGDDLRALIASHEMQGRTVVAIGDEEMWGLIAIADTARPEARDAVTALKHLGIERVVLITGDNRHAAGTIGKAMGVDEVRAELLPHEKVAVVRELQERYGPVAMVGDGVNDAPALATAALGVAMGAAGTDVALESADVLLMSDDLSHLPLALKLARRTHRVVAQNLAFAFTVMASLMAMALIGSINLPVGVVGHEGSTLLVVANGLRLLAIRRA